MQFWNSPRSWRRTGRRLNTAHHHSSTIKSTRTCLIHSGVINALTIATSTHRPTINTFPSATRHLVFGQRQWYVSYLNYTLFSYSHFHSVMVFMVLHIPNPLKATYSKNPYLVSGSANVLPGRSMCNVLIHWYHHALCLARSESLILLSPDVFKTTVPPVYC